MVRHSTLLASGKRDAAPSPMSTFDASGGGSVTFTESEDKILIDDNNRNKSFGILSEDETDTYQPPSLSTHIATTASRHSRKNNPIASTTPSKNAEHATTAVDKQLSDILQKYSTNDKIQLSAILSKYSCKDVALAKHTAEEGKMSKMVIKYSTNGSGKEKRDVSDDIGPSEENAVAETRESIPPLPVGKTKLAAIKPPIVTVVDYPSADMIETFGKLRTPIAESSPFQEITQLYTTFSTNTKEESMNVPLGVNSSLSPGSYKTARSSTSSKKSSVKMFGRLRSRGSNISKGSSKALLAAIVSQNSRVSLDATGESPPIQDTTGTQVSTTISANAKESSDEAKESLGNVHLGINSSLSVSSSHKTEKSSSSSKMSSIKMLGGLKSRGSNISKGDAKARSSDIVNKNSSVSLDSIALKSYGSNISNNNNNKLTVKANGSMASVGNDNAKSTETMSENIKTESPATVLEAPCAPEADTILSKEPLSVKTTGYKVQQKVLLSPASPVVFGPPRILSRVSASATGVEPKKRNQILESRTQSEEPKKTMTHTCEEPIPESTEIKSLPIATVKDMSQSHQISVVRATSTDDSSLHKKAPGEPKAGALPTVCTDEGQDSLFKLDVSLLPQISLSRSTSLGANFGTKRSKCSKHSIDTSPSAQIALSKSKSFGNSVGSKASIMKSSSAAKTAHSSSGKSSASFASTKGRRSSSFQKSVSYNDAAKTHTFDGKQPSGQAMLPVAPEVEAKKSSTTDDSHGDLEKNSMESLSGDVSERSIEESESQSRVFRHSVSCGSSKTTTTAENYSFHTESISATTPKSASDPLPSARGCYAGSARPSTSFEVANDGIHSDQRTPSQRVGVAPASSGEDEILVTVLNDNNGCTGVYSSEDDIFQVNEQKLCLSEEEKHGQTEGHVDTSAQSEKDEILSAQANPTIEVVEPVQPVKLDSGSAKATRSTRFFGRFVGRKASEPDKRRTITPDLTVNTNSERLPTKMTTSKSSDMQTQMNNVSITSVIDNDVVVERITSDMVEETAIDAAVPPSPIILVDHRSSRKVEIIGKTWETPRQEKSGDSFQRYIAASSPDQTMNAPSKSLPRRNLVQVVLKRFMRLAKRDNKLQPPQMANKAGQKMAATLVEEVTNALTTKQCNVVYQDDIGSPLLHDMRVEASLLHSKSEDPTGTELILAPSDRPSPMSHPDNAALPSNSAPEQLAEKLAITPVQIANESQTVDEALFEWCGQKNEKPKGKMNAETDSGNFSCCQGIGGIMTSQPDMSAVYTACSTTVTRDDVKPFLSCSKVDDTFVQVPEQLNCPKMTESLENVNCSQVTNTMKSTINSACNDISNPNMIKDGLDAFSRVLIPSAADASKEASVNSLCGAHLFADSSKAAPNVSEPVQFFEADVVKTWTTSLAEWFSPSADIEDSKHKQKDQVNYECLESVADNVACVEAAEDKMEFEQKPPLKVTTQLQKRSHEDDLEVSAHTEPFSNIEHRNQDDKAVPKKEYRPRMAGRFKDAFRNSLGVRKTLKQNRKPISILDKGQLREEDLFGEVASPSEMESSLTPVVNIKVDNGVPADVTIAPDHVQPDAEDKSDNTGVHWVSESQEKSHDDEIGNSLDYLSIVQEKREALRNRLSSLADADEEKQIPVFHEPEGGELQQIAAIPEAKPSATKNENRLFGFRRPTKKEKRSPQNMTESDNVASPTTGTASGDLTGKGVEVAFNETDDSHTMRVSAVSADANEDLEEEMESTPAQGFEPKVNTSNFPATNVDLVDGLGTSLSDAASLSLAPKQKTFDDENQEVAAADVQVLPSVVPAELQNVHKAEIWAKRRQIAFHRLMRSVQKKGKQENEGQPSVTAEKQTEMNGIIPPPPHHHVEASKNVQQHMRVCAVSDEDAEELEMEALDSTFSGETSCNPMSVQSDNNRSTVYSDDDEDVRASQSNNDDQSKSTSHSTAMVERTASKPRATPDQTTTAAATTRQQQQQTSNSSSSRVRSNKNDEISAAVTSGLGTFEDDLSGVFAPTGGGKWFW